MSYDTCELGAAPSDNSTRPLLHGEPSGIERSSDKTFIEICKGVVSGVARKNRDQVRPSLAALRELMREAMNNSVSIVGGFPSPGMRTESRQEKGPPASLADAWKREFRDLLEVVPPGYRFMTLGVDEQVEVDKVFRDGTFTAWLRQRGQSYRALATIAAKPNFRCNCLDGQSRRPCIHASTLIKFILEQLSNTKSPLHVKVRTEAFDAGSIDPLEFEYDNGPHSLKEIDRILSIAPTSGERVELPPALDAVEVKRLAWNIELAGGIEITPVAQAQKKRGNGWNRGKRIPVNSLWAGNLKMTPVDQQIRSLIEIGDFEIHVPTIPILEALVGATNALLLGDPVEVVAFGGVLRIRFTDASCAKFTLSFEEQGVWPDLTACFGHQGIILVSQRIAKIGVYRCSNVQSETIRQLMNLGAIRAVHLPAVLQRLEKLQSCVNVLLPETEGGPLHPEAVSPVALLRSRRDGRLDVGLRLRDSRGELHRPGQGILVRSGEWEGNKVQFVRSFLDEIKLAEQCRDSLGIPLIDWDGHCQTFQAAMELLSSLQENSDAIEVLWDPTTEEKPKYLGSLATGNVRVSIEKKRDWFQLSGKCTLGDTSMELTTLMQAIGEGRAGGADAGFIRIGDDGWVQISNELQQRLKQLHENVHTERGAMKFDQSSAHTMRSLQSSLHIDAPAAWQKCLDRLKKAEELEPVLPAGLNATLRDYQFDGYRWMRRLAEWGVGGVLADDMGLGKTVQTLAVILDRAGEGPSLVIAPTSVAFNWMREIERFAPELKAHLYRETDRDDFLKQLGPNQVVVCSYGLVLRDAEKLKEVEWNTLVLDEAQAIKNGRSKTSQAIATIPSSWTVALTGTPVENHLGELWSLFRVVAPGVFGGWEQFRNRFASPIERENNEERRLALRERLRPFVLRRTKSEVLKDLPARTEMNVVVELSPAERALYDKVRLSAMTEVEAIANLPDIQDQRFKILALLTRLRQLACHPRLVETSWQNRSAKLEQLKETVLELKEEGHRVLIFSQFVQHLHLIREMLEEEKVTFQYLDGSTPAGQRQVEVDKFQNGDATAFLISLKAGGTGLNLTAADYVIHMDPWWNPAVEDQATDRAHRIGQNKPVMVYRIIAQNTIEEEILKLHDTKRDLIAGVLEGAQAAAKLSTEDLIAMIRKGS